MKRKKKSMGESSKGKKKLIIMPSKRKNWSMKKSSRGTSVKRKRKRSARMTPEEREELFYRYLAESEAQEREMDPPDPEREMDPEDRKGPLKHDKQFGELGRTRRHRIPVHVGHRDPTPKEKAQILARHVPYKEKSEVLTPEKWRAYLNRTSYKNR